MTSTAEQIEHFIATLASLGGSAGNQRLLEALAWPESTYQRIKQQLIETKRINPGRGRGGSVTLAPTEDTVVHIEKFGAQPTQPKTKDLQPNQAPNPEIDYADALWKAADKLRGNMEPSDYKHVALGLIFLKYISDSFEARHAEQIGRAHV